MLKLPRLLCCLVLSCVVVVVVVGGGGGGGEKERGGEEDEEEGEDREVPQQKQTPRNTMWGKAFLLAGWGSLLCIFRLFWFFLFWRI